MVGSKDVYISETCYRYSMMTPKFYKSAKRNDKQKHAMHLVA